MGGEHICRVELGEDPDQLLLCGCLLFEDLPREVVDLSDRVLTVEELQDLIDSGREAVEALRGWVFKDVPDLSAITMPMDLSVRPERRPDLSDPLPIGARALLLFLHGVHFHQNKRNQSTVLWLQVQSRLRLPTLTFPTPSIPGLRISRGTSLSRDASTRK